METAREALVVMFRDELRNEWGRWVVSGAYPKLSNFVITQYPVIYTIVTIIIIILN